MHASILSPSRTIAEARHALSSKIKKTLQYLEVTSISLSVLHGY